MIAKLYYNIKFWYKLKFNKPIYRIDILRAVKYNYENCRAYGICYSIHNINGHCNLKLFVRYRTLAHLFPKLAYDYAKSITDVNYDAIGYWWKIDDWTSGRMIFLNWLIKEYRDDKENLRNIKF